ncbi:MAG: N-6 DNA methylase, partial [Bacillota bacterium]
MKPENVKNIIHAMSFTPLDGTREVYIKKYPIHNNYKISVNFNAEHIEYADSSVEESARICVHSADTSNFKKDENFVILECVDRLLTKGYTPACLELEKRYPLGRREKGRLDILINAPDGTPYILIECKTWGTEFDKEQVLMNRTGGQLFSYYANERAAKFLCLYASKLDGNRFVYKNAIVPVESEWVSLSGTKEIVAAWNGNFKNNGIFESDKTPYNVIHTALTYRDLQTITEEHSEKIYDLIMEILRHNVVSDKPNAFNKLLNLFVCKIIDEDRQPDEIVDFQLMENDGKYDLQMRLNDLYKKGMWRFLNIRVTDYSQSEIEQLTAVEDDAQRNTLKEVITKLRLQKNPEFAFVEVCDDKTFDANDKILREIVA